MRRRQEISTCTSSPHRRAIFAPSRVTLTRALCPLLLLSSGCSAFHKTPVPDPLDPEGRYGQIVREIRFEGRKHTNESLLRTTMVTEAGDTYTREEAERDFARLFQLGVFTKLAFDTEPVEDGIVLVVTMEENSPVLPGLSFAITQENGLELGPAISSPNLFGRATKGSVSARFGGATNIGIQFIDPWRPSRSIFDCCYALQFFHRERNNKLDDFRENSNELFAQWLYNVSDHFHVGPRLTYLGVQAEPDSTGSTPDVTLDPDGRDNIPGLGLVGEYDTRNLIIYPTEGWYIQIDALQHGGFLGGWSDYFRTNIDARRYFELSGPRHSIALYSLVTLTSGEVGVDIPIYEDFHIGGTNSVRGWDLGSRVGKNQWLNTAEYWFNIVERSAYEIWFLRFSMGLQLAAFADVGTAWNTSEELQDNWIAGGGFGVRLIIPQAVMIRFDLAAGQSGGFKLIFHIGGKEKAVAQKFRVR